MRFSFIFALVVASLLLVPGAVADPGHGNGTEENTTGTYIDDGLVLLDHGYDNETGTAYVVLESEVPESVTISDGGSLNRGSGPIAQRTAVVDGRTRIEVRATYVTGRVAVTIDHDDGLYGQMVLNKTHQQNNALIGGPWDEQDVQTAAAAGFGTVTLFVIGQLVLYRRKKSHEPERVA